MSNKADLAETKEPFHSLTAAEVFREFASLSWVIAAGTPKHGE